MTTDEITAELAQCESLRMFNSAALTIVGQYVTCTDPRWEPYIINAVKKYESTLRELQTLQQRLAEAERDRDELREELKLRGAKS